MRQVYSRLLSHLDRLAKLCSGGEVQHVFGLLEVHWKYPRTTAMALLRGKLDFVWLGDGSLENSDLSSAYSNGFNSSALSRTLLFGVDLVIGAHFCTDLPATLRYVPMFKSNQWSLLMRPSSTLFLRLSSHE